MSTNKTGNKTDSGCTTVVSGVSDVVNIIDRHTVSQIGVGYCVDSIPDFVYKSEASGSNNKIEGTLKVKELRVLSDSANINNVNTIYEKQEQQQDLKLQFLSQKQLKDEEKLLEQEKQLEKQLYTGANVSPLWRRVTHKNKIIYIR